MVIILRDVQDCTDKVSSRIAIVTADNGYVKESIMDLLKSYEFSSIFIFHENTIACYPFIPPSKLSIEGEYLLAGMQAW